MKEIVLLKAGELVLKGLNRRSFEDRMIGNMKRRLEGLGKFKVWTSQSTIYVEPMEDGISIDETVKRMQTVFGVAALCPSLVVEKDFDVIAKHTLEYLRDTLNSARTFKVDARRADKTFPLNTPQICMELGGIILDNFPHLTVDVHNPQVTVTIEVRERGAYIHTNQLPGAGGMPVGTGGRGMLLLSGGIDSPVSGYMMSKRGLALSAVHFASPPYTSDRAKQKVITLAQKLVPYTGDIRLFVVNFTTLQEMIRDKCPEDYFTIMMRRVMMRIAERIAEEEKAGGLITGESVGQVASQTLHALACTDIVTKLPVLRPLIGMDKEEIVRIARKIDTFETSILPYEDCCTVFTPKHPKTKPYQDVVERMEENMELPQELIDEAVSTAELILLTRE